MEIPQSVIEQVKKLDAEKPLARQVKDKDFFRISSVVNTIFKIQKALKTMHGNKDIDYYILWSRRELLQIEKHVKILNREFDLINEVAKAGMKEENTAFAGRDLFIIGILLVSGAIIGITFAHLLKTFGL